MKKIGRIYGEAKINMREMIGNRENTTEPPTIRRQTKNIEDMRTYLKEIYTRMQKQSKTNLLSIEENEQVGTAFDEYGLKLKEEGDFASLGDVFVQLASFHQSIENLRTQMDSALQTRVAAPFHDFVSNDVRRARNEKLKYDKARVSYDALHNKAKQMKKKGSIDKIVEVEREVEEYKLVYEEIALDTVKVQSDVCESHAFQTLDRLCEYITIYEDFFTQGLHLAKQISKDLPAYKQSIQDLKEEFKLKKLQRGDADDEPGSNNTFGVPLEDLVVRNNTASGLPLVMEHAIHYIYNNSLKVEGIFRVSGSQKEVQELKKLIGRGIIDFSQVLNDHNVTGILKLFLRELPAPLFPFNLYNPIIQCVQEHGKDIPTCTKDMRVLLDTLPPTNKTCIKYLMGLCHKITSNSSANLMTPRNIAVVLAPNILYSREVSIEAVADANGCIEFLIANYESLFQGSFADLMSAMPAPTPTVPEVPVSRTGTLRGTTIPASPGVAAGASRLASNSGSSSSPAIISAPSAAVQSPAKPAATTATPSKRPAAVRGSSMFQMGQIEREGGDDGYQNALRKAPSEDFNVGGGGGTPVADEEHSPRGYNPSPYRHSVVTPMYPPGQQPQQQQQPLTSSPSVQARPPTASASRGAVISPGPKQLPPRPGGAPGGPKPPAVMTTSGGMPLPANPTLPPPANNNYSNYPPPNYPPPSFPSNLPPPIVHQTVLGSAGKRTTPPPSQLQPPPSLNTPPLKPASNPRHDLIQF